MSIIIILTMLTVVVTTIYYYSKYKYSFWKKHNIPYIEPQLPFGNIKGVGRTTHSSQLTHKFYKELKGKGHPFAGIYLFTKPVMLALDLEFVKTILIKDFSYFQDRGLYFSGLLFSIQVTYINYSNQCPLFYRWTRWPHISPFIFCRLCQMEGFTCKINSHFHLWTNEIHVSNNCWRGWQFSTMFGWYDRGKWKFRA